MTAAPVLSTSLLPLWPLSHGSAALLSLLLTVLCYYLNKRLYRRYPHTVLMPIIGTPVVLVAALLLLGIGYEDYRTHTHWLVWLLGPTTVAFALPLYDYRQMVRKHWMSIVAGVLVASTVSILTSVWLARWLGLSPLLQKGLAMRSVTTPFAVEAERAIGGPLDLAALFVLLTGVTGMLIGGLVLRLLPRLRSRVAAGAMLGGSAHGSGVAKAQMAGPQQGVAASLVMMIAGALNVLAAPWIGAWVFG
ncbi:LrgB family protein [Comamonas sp. MYb69]|uniref:LrgB family protein n=1 Tax=Comamonas sp. MYb69 TaxID=1848650 RepID=UPI0030A594E6